MRTLCAVLLFSVASFAQLARPTLNALEMKKGRAIQSAIILNTAEVSTSQKSLVTMQTQLSQAQAAVTRYSSNVKQPVNGQPLPPDSVAKQLDQKAARAQQAVDAAQHHLDYAQAVLDGATNALTDWETSTLATHKADAGTYKVNWDTGQIVTR